MLRLAGAILDTQHAAWQIRDYSPSPEPLAAVEPAREEVAPATIQFVD